MPSYDPDCTCPDSRIRVPHQGTCPRYDTHREWSIQDRVEQREKKGQARKAADKAAQAEALRRVSNRLPVGDYHGRLLQEQVAIVARELGVEL